MDVFETLYASFSHIEQIQIDTTVLSGKSAIIKFITNIVLVLKGERLAYRCDISDKDINNYVIKTTLEKYPQLTSIPYPSSEPLIVLKENLNCVAMRLLSKSNEMDFHCAIGFILKYPYYGVDWCNCSIDRYMINYTIVYKGVNSTLYGFTIPVDKYNEYIEDSILNKLKVYQHTLEEYNFCVSVRVEILLSDGTIKNITI